MIEQPDPQLDEEQLAAGLTIEGQLDKRFDELFRQAWNTRMLPFIKQQINLKIAEESMKLGRQLGELQNHNGEL
jgi:hypothetical protein